MDNKKIAVSMAVVAGVAGAYYAGHENINQTDKFIQLYANPNSNPLGTTSINSPVGLWMLDSPSMQGEHIEVIPNGAMVNVLGESNGWYKVSYNGQIGWSYAKYTTGLNGKNFSKVESVTGLQGEVASQEGLWLLDSPSMEGNKIEVMPDGGQFEVLGYSGNWTKVSYDGKVGYCYTEYTKTLPGETKSLGQTTITSPVGLWMLESPSFSGSQIQIVPYNTKVNVLGETNGWYKVEYKGVIGWSYAKYTSGLNGTNASLANNDDYNQSTKETYGNVNSKIGLWLLNSPSMQGSKIEILPYGGALKIIGHSGDWSKVSYDGKIGWAYSKYISEISAPKGSTSIINNQINGAPIGTTIVEPMVGLWMLQSPSMQGKQMMVIPYFTQLSVYEVHDGWYKVSYDGQVGWVDAQYTSFLSKNASGVLTIDMENNQNASVHLSPASNSRVVFTVPNTKQVAVKRYVRNWAEINYDGQVGWIQTADTIGVESDYANNAYTANEETNIRTKPDFSAPVIGDIYQGEKVVTYDATRDSNGVMWSKIVVNGTSGWLVSSSLTRD